MDEILAYQPPGAGEALAEVLRKMLDTGRGSVKLPGGGVMLALAIASEAESLMEGNLRRQIKTRKKTKDDNTMVIKVADAIDCVEGELADAEKLITIAKRILHVATSFGTEVSFTDPIVDCIRENALRQDTPRSAHRSTTRGRPAKGHGHK